MTAPKDNKRVIVVGGCGAEGLQAARLLKEHEGYNIEMITPDEAVERGITITKTEEHKLPRFDQYISAKLPETRAERRAKARKKKRR